MLRRLTLGQQIAQQGRLAKCLAAGPGGKLPSCWHPQTRWAYQEGQALRSVKVERRLGPGQGLQCRPGICGSVGVDTQPA